ncbi:hypothetical protein Pmar_PMAR012627 [Perkinsus marinus ATCC 50983]|uniref:Uncharacterized protein n=1 Tax=Perkinsus marinus (strain ATCC 50983 / TXsc) TaxID=423536 RepID=C5K7W0_PERM5|nr:hypothetical protein Pmar_PMAR012627 [Perkinsus marinus ATCC 50983]EER19645.1 hypothetical protein Pmar_PMAR012627 [Perkinsus marinus ATCC 50983]|eukprot:XP_002787849.1 hypothetical protein Pmar_PMAR012627 [Perkinsus marinus ATCC 50983]
MSSGASSAHSGEKGRHSTHRNRHQIREWNRQVAARANAELRNEKLRTLDKDALNKLGTLRNASTIQATLAVDYQFNVDTPVPDTSLKMVPMEHPAGPGPRVVDCRRGCQAGLHRSHRPYYVGWVQAVIGLGPG